MADAILPIVPEFITVHLGTPSSSAENVTVPFTDYIKNVASSEVYPTWPESSLRANIYAQISYALNRVYTEYYRTRGYDFDITNSTQFDQAFVPDRDIFGNISLIVDDIFNDYIVRQGSVEPFFAQFCNGTTVTCDGLSQWGTVSLAEQGLTPYEILQNYYGENINIVMDAPVGSVRESYPGTPLRLGSRGNDVRIIQLQLNRIAQNYPSIPKIDNPEGTFGVQTEASVTEFQRVFNLTPDGIVGKATWYKIKNLYNGVKRLNELTSEGINIEDVELIFPQVIRKGDTGIPVNTLQYYLAVIGYFNSNIPTVEITGTFDDQTEKAVIAVQSAYGLSQDGIVGRNTWSAITSIYKDTLSNLPSGYEGSGAAIFPGETLSVGISGENVRKLQTYLSVVAQNNPALTAPDITGYFGEQTESAVRAFQQQYGIPSSGIVDAITWNSIATAYNSLQDGNI